MMIAPKKTPNRMKNNYRPIFFRPLDFALFYYILMFVFFILVFPATFEVHPRRNWMTLHFWRSGGRLLENELHGTCGKGCDHGHGGG